MKVFKHIFALAVLVALLASCSKYEVLPPDEKTEDITQERFLLITDQEEDAYMETETSGKEQRNRRGLIIEDLGDPTGGITDDDDEDDDTAEAQDKARD